VVDGPRSEAQAAADEQSAGPSAGHPESGSAYAPTLIRPGCWVVVPGTSTATFRVRDFTRRPVVGTFPIVEGEVRVDRAGCPVGVSAVLDATGIETGNARRDRDLRSRHFFDVAAFPTIAFTAADVRPAGAGWVVEGRLLVRDVPCPVVLDLRPDPAGSADGGGGAGVESSSPAVADTAQVADGGAGIDGAPVVVLATTTLDRRDAGIGAGPGFVIGHRVEVEVRATLQPPVA
jgi:polyisoprenoid-binding protein YceI